MTAHCYLSSSPLSAPGALTSRPRKFTSLLFLLAAFALSSLQAAPLDPCPNPFKLSVIVAGGTSTECTFGNATYTLFNTIIEISAGNAELLFIETSPTVHTLVFQDLQKINPYVTNVSFDYHVDWLSPDYFVKSIEGTYTQSPAGSTPVFSSLSVVHGTFSRVQFRWSPLTELDMDGYPVTLQDLTSVTNVITFDTVSTPTNSSIPEPQTYALVGLALILAARKRRALSNSPTA